MIGSAITVRQQDFLLHSFTLPDLIFGSVFILVVLLFRRGILGSIVHLLPQTRSADHPEPAPDPTALADA